MPSAAGGCLADEAWLPVSEMQDRRVYRVRARRGSYGVWVASTRCFLTIGFEVGHPALVAEDHWDDGGTAKPLWRRKRSTKRRVSSVPQDVPLTEGFGVSMCLDGYFELQDCPWRADPRRCGQQTSVRTVSPALGNGRRGNRGECG